MTINRDTKTVRSQSRAIDCLVKVISLHILFTIAFSFRATFLITQLAANTRAVHGLMVSGSDRLPFFRRADSTIAIVVSGPIEPAWINREWSYGWLFEHEEKRIECISN